MKGQLRSTTYGSLRGVDMSVDPSLIDPSRSPFMPNMMPNQGGTLQKRPGWRALWQIEGPVNCLFRGYLNNQQIYLAHGGTKLYTWSDTAAPVIIKEGINNHKSSMFVMNGKIWILTGGEYLYFDGAVCGHVGEIAYVPTTSIARTPDGTVQTVFEQVNLLSPKRKNTFIGDGVAKDYYLDFAGLDTTAVTATINGVPKTEGADFTVNRILGVVSFNTPPPAPAVAGQSNVEITAQRTVTGYVQRITNSDKAALYGSGAPNTVFVYGNPNYKNRDYYSWIGDPAYMPDLNYTIVGGEGNRIMGYVRIGEYLGIVKEDNEQDATIYLRSPETGADGIVFYRQKQGIAGVGAISPEGFANLGDEPLFLSRQGVYAITSNAVTAERIVQNRSYFVDAKLTREEELDSAAAVSWNGFYMVASGGRCYLLSGRNKFYPPDRPMVYECYHWENFPARCFLEQGGALYFGTNEGKICKLNTDINTMDRFNDYTGLDKTNPMPVICAFATKNDNDGTTSVVKQMIKKGCSVTLMPYLRSSASVCLVVDGEAERQICYETMDIFDWEDIDFGRFTLNSNESPQEILFRHKVKGYKRLQILIRNSGLSEGFGIFEINKTFIAGDFAKR